MQAAAFVAHPRHVPGGGAAREADLTELQRHFHVRPHEKPSPLYQATLGLSHVYNRVGSRRGKPTPRGGWGGQQQEHCMYTTEDGTLRLGPHLPVFMGRYRFLGLLGQGTFSQIICAEDTYHPERRQVAVKILNFHYSEIGKREAVCLRLLHASKEGPHCSILRFYSAFDFMGHFCLVLELCRGGSLDSFLRPTQEVVTASPGGPPCGLSLAQVREVALHLVKALLLLHNHDLIHADLKLENVLLAAAPGGGVHGGGGGGGIMSAAVTSMAAAALGPNVRLTDLGNAIKTREVKLYKDDYEIQTISYRAPEVLLGGSGGSAFDNKIDMWSLGVLLVELFIGRPLFRASCKLLLVKRIVSVLGPLPARVYVTGKFYNGYFGPDHRLKEEVLRMKDDPVQETTATIDPGSVQNPFSYSPERHYRLVCELLKCRDSDFISFITGLLQLDPACRLSALDALLHPFLAPCFPFSLLSPYLTLPPTPARPRTTTTTTAATGDHHPRHHPHPPTSSSSSSSMAGGGGADAYPHPGDHHHHHRGNKEEEEEENRRHDDHHHHHHHHHGKGRMSSSSTAAAVPIHHHRDTTTTTTATISRRRVSGGSSSGGHHRRSGTMKEEEEGGGRDYYYSNNNMMTHQSSPPTSSAGHHHHNGKQWKEEEKGDRGGSGGSRERTVSCDDDDEQDGFQHHHHHHHHQHHHDNHYHHDDDDGRTSSGDRRRRVLQDEEVELSAVEDDDDDDEDNKNNKKGSSSSHHGGEGGGLEEAPYYSSAVVASRPAVAERGGAVCCDDDEEGRGRKRGRREVVLLLDSPPMEDGGKGSRRRRRRSETGKGGGGGARGREEEEDDHHEEEEEEEDQEALFL